MITIGAQDCHSRGPFSCSTWRAQKSSVDVGVSVRQCPWALCRVRVSSLTSQRQGTSMPAVSVLHLLRVERSCAHHGQIYLNRNGKEQGRYESRPQARQDGAQVHVSPHVSRWRDAVGLLQPAPRVAQLLFQPPLPRRHRHGCSAVAEWSVVEPLAAALQRTGQSGTVELSAWTSEPSRLAAFFCFSEFA